MPRDYVRNRPSSRANQKPRSNGGFVWLLAGIFIGLIIAGVYYVKNHPPSPLPPEKNNPVVSVPAVVNTADKSASTPETGKTKPVSSSVRPANAASQNLQTQFDFYNVLPGKGVTGPSGDEDVSAVKPAAQAPASSPSQAPQAAQKNSVTQITHENNDDSDNNQTSENTASPSAENDDADSSSDENNSSAIKATQAKPKDTSSAQVLKPKGFVLQLGTFSQYADADKLKAQLVLLGFDVKSTTVTKNGKSFTRVWLGPFHTEDEASSVNEQLKENNISAKLLKSTA